jgi:broad specificity phosphatase PhoE
MRRQARAAGGALAHSGIRRILASPYTRALQTAAEVADMLHVPVQIDAMVRERFAFACDIGTAASRLMQEWPAHDFSAIEEVWWPDAFEPEIAVMLRADGFRASMRRNPDAASTLLVSHWGFILALTGRSIGNGEWDPAESAPRELVWRH